MTPTIKAYVQANKDRFLEELFELLREELAQSRKEREKLAVLVERLLSMQNGQYVG